MTTSTTRISSASSNSVASPTPRGRRLREAGLIGAAAFAFAVAAHAGPVFVPNGDFSFAGNAGSIGGGIIGGSAVDMGIGADLGPWTGSYSGAIGLLAPPVLTIDDSTLSATIGGLVGIDVLGIVSNEGYFSQTLPTAYLPDTRYTIGVDIDSGELLGLSALAAANVGISLRSAGAVLGASTTAPADLVSLNPLGGTAYRLTLVYDTGASPSGDIDIQLFNQPQGLLTLDLVPDITFGNVTLNAGAITDATTQLLVSGLSSQGAEVETPFGAPLVALVTDMNGDPLEGVIVTVSAPPTGASAVLTSGADSGTSVQAITGEDGLVTVGATANSVAGCYKVTASVGGTESRAVFSLRNWSAAEMHAFLDSGIDMRGALQDSIFCDGFE